MSTGTVDKNLVKTLTKQLEEKQLLVEGIASEFKHEDGKFVVSKEQHSNYRKAVNEAQEIKGLIDAAKQAESNRSYLDAPESDEPPAAASGFRGGRTMDPLEGKSLGDLFIDSDAYQEAKERGFKHAPHIRADIEGKSIFNLTAGNQPSMQALGQAQATNWQLQARRKKHIRDLFPKASTRAAVLHAIRETGWVNNATQVKQRYAADGVSPATGLDTDVFGKAPRSKLLLTPVLIPVVEIAHLLDAHKNILSDEPRLRQFINMRMVEGVKYTEDFDILHGVGDGESMTGIFNTPGVQQYTGVSSDEYSVQIRRAVTKALLAEYEPNGLVISPTMWERVEVEEGNDGQFRVAMAVAVGAEKRIWRLDVAETTAIEDTKFLVGAFGMGAQLYDRENVSVAVSTENADMWERGAVTFRAEERVALEVVRPESFVVGTWTTPV